MNAEHELLASAYLDGELTDEERRIAEADPAVMAEVEQLRALRDELASPPPPSEAAREAAIAAAMGEFAERYGAAPAAASAAAASSVAASAPTQPTEPTVVPFRPRPAIGRWLSVAAAVVVIGLLGVVMAAGLRGGGDDDDAAFVADEAAAEEPAADEPAAEEPAEERLTEAATAGADDGDDALAYADDAEPEMAGDEAAAEEPAAEEPAAEEPASDEEPAEEAADEPADEPASDAEEPVADMIDPAAFLDEGIPISTEAELAGVGRLLVDRLAKGTLGSTPEEACPFPNMLDRAEIFDPASGEVRPVVIDVDIEADLVRAVDIETCEIWLETTLSNEG